MSVGLSSCVPWKALTTWTRKDRGSDVSACDTLTFCKPTFPFLEFFHCCSGPLFFMVIFGGLVVFGPTIENILPQIQLWGTMSQAELYNI